MPWPIWTTLMSTFVENYSATHQATVYSTSELASAARAVSAENKAFEGDDASTMANVIIAESQDTTVALRLKNLRLQLLKTLHSKAEKSYIDVWWLYDDGGLSMLVPHLLRLDGSYLHGAKIRVFTGDHHVNNVEEERKNVEAMLDKFRISVSLVTVLNTWHQEPTVES